MTKKPWQRQVFVKTNVQSVLEQGKRVEESCIIWLSWSGRYALIVVPMKRSMVSRPTDSFDLTADGWMLTAILSETEQKNL